MLLEREQCDGRGQKVNSSPKGGEIYTDREMETDYVFFSPILERNTKNMNSGAVLLQQSLNVHYTYGRLSPRIFI